MRRLGWVCAGVLALWAAVPCRAQYGDISDLKVNRPEDKIDVKSEPAPKGANVLFDGTGLTIG
jgi:hypothetical protein